MVRKQIITKFEWLNKYMSIYLQTVYAKKTDGFK